MIIVTYRRRHKIDELRDITTMFHSKDALIKYLYNELYCKNPIIVTGIWEVE